MKSQHPLYPLIPLFLLGLFWLSGCGPGPTAAERMHTGAADPSLAATAQADQYWRDARSTTEAQEATQAANYRNVQGTAVAAQATSEAEQTRAAFEFSLTVAAATREAELTATAEAQAAAMATATETAVIAQATQQAIIAQAEAARVATREAQILADQQRQLRRDNVSYALRTTFIVFGLLLFGFLSLYLLWLLLALRP